MAALTHLAEAAVVTAVVGALAVAAVTLSATGVLWLADRVLTVARRSRG